VTAATGVSAPTGDYVYELRFCLCPGFRNASLTMSVLADNAATIFLNGNQIGTVSGPNGTGFVNPPKPVNTSTQSFFLQGQNVLTVRVSNQSSFTGLLAGGQITADAGQCRQGRR
ncbi:MAG: hypothetical protein ACLGI9_15900, partial [Thermoanaerobaculia bacterium]